jgi:hypothetical protein
VQNVKQSLLNSKETCPGELNGQNSFESFILINGQTMAETIQSLVLIFF